MATWYASPTGTAGGDGAGSPWDITTALEDKTGTVTTDVNGNITGADLGDES